MNDLSDCVRCEKSLVAYLPKVLLGDNCRECGKYAFSFETPAFLYLITSEQLGQYKIGFGRMGKSRDRLKRDVEAGWSVLALWHTGDEKKALAWEREVFKALKAQLAPLSGDEDPMGDWVEGWAQSIKAQAISTAAIKKLIDRVVQASS